MIPISPQLLTVARGRRLVAAGTCLVLAVGTMALVPTPVDAATPPRGLGGVGFDTRNVTASCINHNTGGGATLEFEAEGPTVPDPSPSYPGTFTLVGTATIGTQQPNFTRPLLSVAMEFTVASAEGTVTGTIAFVGETSSGNGTCQERFDGTMRSGMTASDLRFSATIVTPDGQRCSNVGFANVQYFKNSSLIIDLLTTSFIGDPATPVPVCDAPPSTDTTPPVLTVPGTVTVRADDAHGAPVSYTVSAADDIDADPVVACTPPSGSTFPVGTTTVACTATDDAGNVTADSFSVVVAHVTVVVFIEGIDPLPNLTDERTKDPASAMAAPGLFGPMLGALGCPAPTVARQVTTTLPCNDGLIHWAAYSFAGVDAAGVPRLYRGADTHQPLSVSAGHLEDLVTAIRRHHGPHTNLVVVGFSLGGTIAARWASDNRVTDVPVVTVASPLYGMWPDARSTRAAGEDFDWFCNPVTAGSLAGPLTDAAILQSLCAAWPVSFVPLGRFGHAWGGFRSPASYDWRTGQVFAGPGQPSDLILLNVGNRRDMVAPVFWQVRGDATALLLGECSDEAGHGCVKALPSVTTAVRRVVQYVKAWGHAAVAADRAGLAATFNAGAPSPLTNPPQLRGYSLDVAGPADWRITAVGERVVTYGATAADDRAAVTCVGGTVRRTDRGIRISWSDWRPHSLVVRFEHRILPLTFQAVARVVPADDPPGNTYHLELTPLPGRSDGVCRVA